MSTGIEEGCDADGDGVADPGCPPGASTGIEQVQQEPERVQIPKRAAPKRSVTRGSKGKGINRKPARKRSRK